MLREIYARDPTDLKYSPAFMETSDKVEALIAKLRMILYTNRGEILGEPYLGMDLENNLFDFNINEGEVRDRFYAQLAKYVPEHVNYDVDCSMGVTSDGVKDTAYLYITINNEKVLGLSL